MVDLAGVKSQTPTPISQARVPTPPNTRFWDRRASCLQILASRGAVPRRVGPVRNARSEVLAVESRGESRGWLTPLSRRRGHGPPSDVGSVFSPSARRALRFLRSLEGERNLRPQPCHLGARAHVASREINRARRPATAGRHRRSENWYLDGPPASTESAPPHGVTTPHRVHCPRRARA